MAIKSEAEYERTVYWQQKFITSVSELRALSDDMLDFPFRQALIDSYVSEIGILNEQIDGWNRDKREAAAQAFAKQSGKP